MSSVRIPKRLKQSPAYHRAPAQERQVAGQVGGQRVALSGAGDEKHDVRAKGKMRIECKATSKGSYALNRDALSTLLGNAACAGETPVMHIEFLTTDDRPPLSVIVLPAAYLEHIKDL